MRRSKTLIAAIGAAVLVAGSLAMAQPASGGGVEQKPWPILQVAKTIGQASPPTEGTIDVPPETVFTITVTCEYPNNNVNAAGDPFPETILTFDSTGAPKSANQGGWQDLGDGFWTFQGPELKYKQCTAVETDVDPEPAALEVAYKCDALAEPVEIVPTGEETEATAAQLEFGCIEPLPEGEYAPAPPATAASVQFTAFWDFEACGIVKEVSVANGTKCQETGTLTVDNLDPAWVVVSPANVVAVELTPTFTG